MLFNTTQYIIFLPIVILIYYILPAKIRYIWLLIASYYFYMQWNPAYVLLLLFCTVLTFLGGQYIEKKSGSNVGGGVKSFRVRESVKGYLFLCILVSLSFLGFFKYFSFFINVFNHLLEAFHLKQISYQFNILLPVGISFYILQSLGYLIDVYRGDIYAEKNFLRYALFVSFFPQLVAGPIERSKNLLVQLHESHRFEFRNLKKGTLLILYGLFLKMVIADRAAILVDTVYENPAEYPGFYIVWATAFFAIQIYCDFYGYSTIARGSALIMGIKLMDNFLAPYFSKNVKEFWRRWHTSLSSWFRDYLYIPLGGNRKGTVRSKLNLMLVFGISGLWHGASLAYVVWGLLNGVYQVIADIREKISKFIRGGYEEILRRVGIIPEKQKGYMTFSARLFHTIVTFLLVTFAWLFFRAGGIHTALELLRLLLSNFNWIVLFDGSLFDLGIEKGYMYILLLSVLVLFLSDYYKYKGKDSAELILSQGWIAQIGVYIALTFVILLYGCYGTIYDTNQFIYFQF